ncbi:MAG: hypothetical protein EOO90_29955 [Pedobacter sp.]|nr:MAG: hypothetical protein EOO90_29955 [Pedobacter sp.]
MILALRILLNILIVALFLYSKLLPHKDKLNAKYVKAFNIFQSIFLPVLNFLKTLIKPFQVGQGLAVDMTQIVLLIVLLLLNNYF